MHLFKPFAQLTTSDKFEVREHSRGMPLKGGPKSQASMDLIDHLHVAVLIPHREGRGTQTRPTALAAYKTALGALLPDLLTAARSGRWGAKSTSNKALGSAPGGQSAHKDVRKALEAAGLLEVLPGYGGVEKRFGKEHKFGALTCFRPTAALVNIAAEFGIRLHDLHDHFTLSRQSWVEPADVVEKRVMATLKDGKKVAGQRMAIDLEDPKTSQIIDRMVRLNTFLLEEGRVEGIAFGGLRRVFTNGNQPGFDWQWHGRFYSLRGWEAYEMKEKVTRRAYILLDGEAVDEVDISACHLAILHGLLGQPFDGSRDPYDIPEYGGDRREYVKDWITMALGSGRSDIGGPARRMVRQSVIAAYPVLGNLEDHGVSTHDLTFHESEIILMAMERLRDAHQITSLPIHDGLIIPGSKRELAMGAVKNAFQSYFHDTLGLPMAPVPRVRLAGPRPSGPRSVPFGRLVPVSDSTEIIEPDVAAPGGNPLVFLVYRPKP